MRANIHDATIRFRVNETLLSAAEIKARRDGMSLSEFVRHAIRKELKETA